MSLQVLVAVLILGFFPISHGVFGKVEWSSGSTAPTQIPDELHIKNNPKNTIYHLVLNRHPYLVKPMQDNVLEVVDYGFCKETSLDFLLYSIPPMRGITLKNAQLASSTIANTPLTTDNKVSNETLSRSWSVPLKPDIASRTSRKDQQTSNSTMTRSASLPNSVTMSSYRTSSTDTRDDPELEIETRILPNSSTVLAAVEHFYEYFDTALCLCFKNYIQTSGKRGYSLIQTRIFGGTALRAMQEVLDTLEKKNLHNLAGGKNRKSQLTHVDMPEEFNPSNTAIHEKIRKGLHTKFSNRLLKCSKPNYFQYVDKPNAYIIVYEAEMHMLEKYFHGHLALYVDTSDEAEEVLTSAFRQQKAILKARKFAEEFKDNSKTSETPHLPIGPSDIGTDILINCPTVRDDFINALRKTRQNGRGASSKDGTKSTIGAEMWGFHFINNLRFRVPEAYNSKDTRIVDLFVYEAIENSVAAEHGSYACVLCTIKADLDIEVKPNFADTKETYEKIGFSQLAVNISTIYNATIEDFGRFMMSWPSELGMVWQTEPFVIFGLEQQYLKDFMGQEIRPPEGLTLQPTNSPEDKRSAIVKFLLEASTKNSIKEIKHVKYAMKGQHDNRYLFGFYYVTWAATNISDYRFFMLSEKTFRYELKFSPHGFDEFSQAKDRALWYDDEK